MKSSVVCGLARARACRRAVLGGGFDCGDCCFGCH